MHACVEVTQLRDTHRNQIEMQVCTLQATDTQSHRWNLYVRGINGDDISHVIKKVRNPGECRSCGSNITNVLM